jgi:hypothetical protein
MSTNILFTILATTISNILAFNYSKEEVLADQGQTVAQLVSKIDNYLEIEFLNLERILHSQISIANLQEFDNADWNDWYDPILKPIANNQAIKISENIGNVYSISLANANGKVLFTRHIGFQIGNSKIASIKRHDTNLEEMQFLLVNTSGFWEIQSLQSVERVNQHLFTGYDYIISKLPQISSGNCVLEPVVYNDLSHLKLHIPQWVGQAPRVQILGRNPDFIHSITFQLNQFIELSSKDVFALIQGTSLTIVASNSPKENWIKERSFLKLNESSNLILKKAGDIIEQNPNLIKSHKSKYIMNDQNYHISIWSNTLYEQDFYVITAISFDRSTKDYYHGESLSLLVSIVLFGLSNYIVWIILRELQLAINIMVRRTLRAKECNFRYKSYRWKKNSHVKEINALQIKFGDLMRHYSNILVGVTRKRKFGHHDNIKVRFEDKEAKIIPI